MKLKICFSCNFFFFLMMLFFQLDWAGAFGGRWAGPELLAGGSAGSWVVGAEAEMLQC